MLIDETASRQKESRTGAAESIKNYAMRKSIRLFDSASNSKAVREFVACLLYLRSFIESNPEKKRLRLIAAYQLAESPLLVRSMSGALRRQKVSNEPVLRLSVKRLRHYKRHTGQRTEVSRSLMLKAPAASGERGVLLIQFEYNWFRILDGVSDFPALAEKYDIVWGTSWSPTDYALLDCVLRASPREVYILPSHHKEADKLRRFNARIRCPPVLSACDWLNPKYFHPKQHKDRTTDILMVANWAPFKRHFELFDALRHMSPDLRVTLIGQLEGGRTADDIIRLLRIYGIKQNVTVLENLPIDEVTRHQCDAKVVLLLSKREGSCVAATEALFSGAALGMIENGSVGATRHVNSETGIAFSSRNIAKELKKLLIDSSKLDPRAWAEKNISCHKSLQKLEDFMRIVALDQGAPWSEGLADFHWRPYPTYESDQTLKKFASEYRLLHGKFPTVFAEDLLENSHH